MSRKIPMNEANDMLKRGDGHKIAISLTDLGRICDDEGIPFERVKPALAAGVLVAYGKPSPDRRSYSDVTVTLGSVKRFIELEREWLKTRAH